MANQDAKEVIQVMSTGVSQEMAILKEATSGLLTLLANLVSKDRDHNIKTNETGKTLDDVLEETGDIGNALNNVPIVTVPYVNRIAFEKEMMEAGLRFARNSDIDMGEIEQQMYIIDSKDKIQAFELVKKYSYLQPRHIITNEEQEKEYFQGCPITDVKGFDKTSADRALNILDNKGVLVSVSFNLASGDYTLRVPRDKEKMLLETIKEVELFRDNPDRKWIDATAAYRSLINNHIKNAGDFHPDDPSVIFDSEKPNHIVIVSKEGFEERYITLNENNELEDQFVYRNSLNNAITHKRYEELKNSNIPEDRQKATEFRPSYEKMTENREEFDLKLATIADRMGTVAFIDKKAFDLLTEEQKLAPGLITQQSLESQLILAQEGDRLKAYTINRDEKGVISLELNTSIQHGETDVNRDRIDRAVKSTESEKILDAEEIGINKQDQEKQTPQEEKKRIETNLVIRSSGFAAGEQKRDGQSHVIERDSRDRNTDYRDINDSGTINDELLKAEQKGMPALGIGYSDEKYFDGQEGNDREEQGFFDED